MIAAYPYDFTFSELEDHINDLISRFRNKALQDTLFRVGQDLVRKLGANDRYIGSINLALQHNMPYDLILEAMSYGFFFRVKDENGNLFPTDIDFLEAVTKDVESAIINNLGLDPLTDSILIKDLKTLYARHTQNVT